MSKYRTASLFVAAISLGLGATWYANQWLINTTAVAEKAVETNLISTPVIVAALEIPFGQKVEASHLKTIQWPGEIMPEGIFNDPATIVGKIANTKIMQNELVLNSRVVDEVGGSVLAAIVSPKMRAVTIRVNDVLGVAGFLLPGNQVDVLATRQEDNKRPETETILEGLKVLAVDQTASTEEDKPIVVRTVTVEALPEQAEHLVRASEEGTVQLVLRNPSDDSRIVKKEPIIEKEQSPPQKEMNIFTDLNFIPLEPIIEKELQKVVDEPVVVKKKEPKTVIVVRGSSVEKSNTKI
ncbi:MAG: Flp pilus assembly protein CpaB [Gammaproteobacteria bacterium]